MTFNFFIPGSYPENIALSSKSQDLFGFFWKIRNQMNFLLDKAFKQKGVSQSFSNQLSTLLRFSIFHTACHNDNNSGCIGSTTWQSSSTHRVVNFSSCSYKYSMCK